MGESGAPCNRGLVERVKRSWRDRNDAQSYTPKRKKQTTRQKRLDGSKGNEVRQRERRCNEMKSGYTLLRFFQPRLRARVRHLYAQSSALFDNGDALGSGHGGSNFGGVAVCLAQLPELVNKIFDRTSCCASAGRRLREGSVRGSGRFCHSSEARRTHVDEEGLQAVRSHVSGTLV